MNGWSSSFLYLGLTCSSLMRQVLTKSTNSMVKQFPFSLGLSCGGSPCTTWVSCSKTLFHFGYGNRPVATSIKVIPRLQTSDLTSYPMPLAGSIRSGAM
uniref:Putative secreted protein n=1 Tax=Ixodes ricinus TaxID=34613 RepID=A0A6B0U7Z6_IXORI